MINLLAFELDKLWPKETDSFTFLTEDGGGFFKHTKKMPLFIKEYQPTNRIK
jgi:hypothetical protein